MEVNEVQLLNETPLMWVTPAGIDMLPNLVQLVKARMPILVRLSGKVALVSSLQKPNA